MIKRSCLLASTVLATACSSSPPEVVRGPQGTVFGQSVIGTVINVVPDEPLDNSLWRGLSRSGQSLSFTMTIHGSVRTQNLSSRAGERQS